ncbi:hypothetical protein N1851_020155 [Merluccius polli]|uniref:Uncharacterized protein n=1 Tax=Merluccius polli TaxID=89951 RepID=A0AA47NZ53_MERPO|nr:hypothetical protein N1851_020155 [Merluccius polli]
MHDAHYRGNYQYIHPYKSGPSCGDCPNDCDDKMCTPEGRWILEDLVELNDWAKMKFKTAKSRSLVLRRGHSKIARLLWPLLVYEVPVSTVGGLERKINTYLRRRLGIPRSYCSIDLYSTGSKLQLPVTSMVEEYKATKHARP